MFVRFWRFVTTASIVYAATDGTEGVSVNKQGVLKLYGNSFGRPGYNDTYDYIIVGGGNGGNTVAARLALDPANYTVAVIEAGNFYELTDGNRTQVPGYNYINTIVFPLGEADTPTTWGLHTVPQKNFDNRKVYYPQGRTFGGGTAANYMGYHRPTAGAFDQWAEIVDDDYWSWDNVYPAYKKSCHFQRPDFSKLGTSFNFTWDESAFVPDGGPLHVSYGNYQGTYGPSLSAALAKTGFQALDGFNSGKLIGYATATGTIDTRYATRDTSETSFLQEAAQKTGIKIYPDALGSRVVFDDQKRAIGVEVKSNLASTDFTYMLKARKEVILSAGVWHTPQVLMLSGLGPAHTLQDHGIDVVADLPGVGQHQTDQVTIPFILNVSISTNTQINVGNPAAVSAAVTEYLDKQTGPLSGFGTGPGMAFEKFPKAQRSRFSNSTLSYLSTFPSDWPEVEYLPLVSTPILPGVSPEDNLMIYQAVLLSTQSRGNMTITSADILDPPVINPNFLEKSGDLEQALAAFDRIREIVANWGSDIVLGEIAPGSTITSRDDIIAYLRENMSHIYHGASTCKMGRKDDPLAVVDSQSRVFGVSGLCIVDMSAFPILPPGHPMSSMYMFAEKIAEKILSSGY